MSFIIILSLSRKIHRYTRIDNGEDKGTGKKRKGRLKMVEVKIHERDKADKGVHSTN
jgi:hypothetical protein